MKKSEAIAWYEGNVSALARALRLDQSSPYSWGEYPPDKHQLALERITGGKLKAEPECEARALGLVVDTKPAKKAADHKQARAH